MEVLMHPDPRWLADPRYGMWSSVDAIYLVRERMRFVAVDVETANPDMASICAIGVAVFEGGVIADEWYTLINPDDHLHSQNIAVHGITECMVAGAPSFLEARSKIDRLFDGSVVVSHTHFDRVAMQRASELCGLQPPSCTWLDSAKVARRVWAECARGGYGLKTLCNRIGYEFEHHHALEDAKAAGHVLLSAMRDTGMDLSAVLRRVQQPVTKRKSDYFTKQFGESVKREGNPDGPLFGEAVVFTGPLRASRSEVADRAAALGCRVAQSVSKKITILVVGGEIPGRLAESEKSSKLKSAEQLASHGIPIRIMSEAEFDAFLASGVAGAREMIAS